MTELLLTERSLSLILLGLLTWLLHSTVLLAGVWLLDRLGALRRSGRAETAWRLALFGGVLSAGLQLAWVHGPTGITPSAAAPSAALMANPPATADSAFAANQVADPTPGLAPEQRAAAAPARTLEAVHTDLLAATSADLPATTPPSTPATTTATTPTTTSAGISDAVRPNLPASALRLNLPAALQPAIAPLTLAWLLLAGLGVAGVLFSRWRLLRRSAALPDLADAALTADAAALAAAAGVRTPRLRLLTDADSPLLMPDGSICLPRWTLLQLDREQQRAMLAHEIGHLRRGDRHWRLAQALLGALLLLQPLHRLAARRLDALAEQACDAWAAQQTGAPRALAESLYLCARRLQPIRRRQAPQLALAMAGHASPLRARINALMENHPMPYKKASALMVSVIAVAVFGALVAAPQLAFEHALADSPEVSIHREVSHRGEYLKSTIRSNGRTLKAEFRGKIVFNDAESDIASLNGTASIEDEQNGVSHRLDLSAGANGQPQRTYQRNDKVQAFDAEAQRWLAGALPTLLRETGWDAEGRVKRLRARGGNAAVLQEIAAIQPSHARRLYSDLLVSQGTLNAAEQAQLIALVAAMGSDFERREALMTLLDKQTLASTEQLALLRTVASFGSDFEKRETLIALAPELADQPELHGVLLSTLTGIGSAYETRSVIEALAERDTLSPGLLTLSLQASGAIGSAFEARSALEALAPKVTGSSAVMAYAQAAQRINSDFERRSALVTLMEHSKLDASGCAHVLAAIKGMNSNYEIREVLVNLAPHLPRDAELIRAYRKQARELGDYERGEAEQAIDHLDS